MELLAALVLQAGYNATLVTLGAALLGAAAGVSGMFLFLRRRALVSDAVAHATLPGVGIAFLVMVSLGGDGRWLPGLLVGSAATALIGLIVVEWLVRRTRLAEDAAIGAVLSVFFGIGVVLLTVIQGLGTGRAAGLEGFLLGSAAGMLRSEAVLIAVGGLAAILATVASHRAMTVVSFDPGFAAATGVDVRATDRLIMGLVAAVTVIGLKIVGLVLIVALLIVPAVAARFWTDRIGVLMALSGAFGALAGYVGAGLSAAAPSLPTGPVIVLALAAIFAASLLAAPNRGVIATVWRRARAGRRLAAPSGSA